MQQTTIDFDQVQVQPVESLRERILKMNKSVRQWLNSRSVFYSRIAGYSVTRLLVLRVNAVSICLIAAAVCFSQQPVISLVSTTSAAWLVYRLNRKGGAK